MKDMIAYCGLNCEKCDAYIATKNNDNALREKTAKVWAELNNAPITPEMINCEGCKVDGLKTPFCDSMCEIRKCALQNKVGTCGDCANLSKCKTIEFVLDNNENAKNNLLDKK